MKKTTLLTITTFASLYATPIQLESINVVSSFITEVAQNAKVSADVANVLSDSIPSVDMSRRSGIANDILIRGQKRDNISVDIDGIKVCGACPNRMDPPVSHVLSSQIQSIEVTEGPYDVTNLGTMSGGVKITTKQPTKETIIETNIGFGAFQYKKFGATVSGGNDFIRILTSVSRESSDQYKDGDGNTLAQQIINKVPKGNQLQKQYEDIQGYTKDSFMLKVNVSVTKNQELHLSYTANRSDNILYANSPMDALVDDSNIYSIDYDAVDLTQVYKNVNLQYYYSDVDHAMSTQYRNKAKNPTKNKTNHMKSTMQGVKLKNNFDFNSYKLLLGLDASQRTWTGEYINNVSAAYLGDSLDNAVTNNMAIFATLKKNYTQFEVKLGARLDSTNISNDNIAHQSNDYTGINVNIFTYYLINEEAKAFIGIGQASRVPDGRELYFQKKGSTIGTPNLKQTTNQELDLGYEIDNDALKLKVKLFYSSLKDYIYIQKGLSSNGFKNIDAAIYGAELSFSYYINDNMTLDIGSSYKRGQKSEALVGQTDKDLADMAPLRGNVGINYEYANNSIATVELQASDKWNDYDSDNGEQAIDGWSVLNIKVKHAVNKKFDFTIGINNLFNTTYSQSNTYADLTLLTSGGGEVMLLNDPGRYLYANVDFRF